MNGIHIMDECFHGLMHTCYRFVDSMLYDTFLVSESVQGLLQIICKFFLVEMRIILAVQFFQVFDFLNVAVAHVRSQIEVECRDCLASMHFILGGFQ